MGLGAGEHCWGGGGGGGRGTEYVTRQVLSPAHKIPRVSICIFPGVGRMIDFSEGAVASGKIILTNMSVEGYEKYSYLYEMCHTNETR